MMNKSLFLGFCLIFASNFILGNACGAFKADDEDEEFRRKRQIRNDKEMVTKTRLLRAYFTACLTARAPQITDWQTNVEYSVLDTIWFEHNALLNCGFGNFVRAKCWKKNLLTYIDIDAEITPYVEKCIDDYARDFSQNPPNLTRYPSIKIDRKRSTRTLKQSTSVQEIDIYTTCLTNAATVFQDPDYDLNFTALTEFIDQYTVNNSCFAPDQFLATPDNLTWPRRFVGFTRSDSPLRVSLQECGEEVFPEVFPVEDPVVVTMGFWGTWSNWGECSTRCGNGQQSRKRECIFVDNGKPVDDPTLCGCYDGLDVCTTERRSCIGQKCGNNYWSEWSNISSCSATCGLGQEIKVRICRSGETNQMIDFRKCPMGLHTRVTSCNYPPCPPLPRNVRSG